MCGLYGEGDIVCSYLCSLHPRNWGRRKKAALW